LTAPETISRSRDIVGALPTKILMFHVTSPRPAFQGWFAIRGLALATVNPPRKFEVSISTHYEDIKGDTKCRNGVVWGS